jgi:hypothetical protein
MIEGAIYINKVREYFSFLTNEFEFTELHESENGNAFYDVEYNDTNIAVSVSYENIEDCLLVIIFLLENGIRPNYDDKTHTLHLNALNKMILPLISKDDIEDNNSFFDNHLTNGPIERKLLKSAKELRLILINWNKLIL